MSEQTLLLELEWIQVHGIDSVVFTIDDPANMEATLDTISKLDIDWDTYKVDANNSAYEKMMGPIEKVASFAKIVIWIVAIAGGIILTLILTLWIRERMYETGILLSLGESRIKIILGYLIEVIIIAVIASSISIFSGRYLAKQLGNTMLASEVTASEEENTSNNNGPMRLQMGTENTSNVEVIDSIDVELEIADIINVYLVGFGLILVGTLLPAVTVLRYNPKKILTNAN